jgi:hypothetical protein
MARGRETRHLAASSLIGTREASAQCYEGVGTVPPPGTDAQSLLLGWESMWQAHVRHVSAEGRRPSVARCIVQEDGRVLLRPVATSLLAVGVHAAAMLAAPMLLRGALDATGTVRQQDAIAVVCVSYLAHLMFRISAGTAMQAGGMLRACMLQAAFRRAILDESVPPTPRAGRVMGPLYASLPLLSADADALAACMAPSIHALFAPAIGAAAMALMWHVLGVAGLTAALVVIALAGVTTSRLCARLAGMWPLALMMSAAPLAAACGFALVYTRGERETLSAGSFVAMLWLLDILRACIAGMSVGASSCTRLAAAHARLSIALAPSGSVIPSLALATPRPALPPELLPHLSTPGALIAVCGPPSSGKSALCHWALLTSLGAQRRERPECRAAYTGPHPYVMAHAPLRDNITFGLAFDARRYAHVCECTGVRSAVFDPRSGVGGDLSRPCDGQPLSHEQVVLLCLARCAYRQPHVAVLDCRLGSLGPTALNALFARAVRSGPLASATRIVVVDAGALHLLADSDCAVLLGRGGALVRCGPMADVASRSGGGGASLAALLAAGGTTRPLSDVLASTSRIPVPQGPPASLRARGLRRSDTWAGGTTSGLSDVESGGDGTPHAAPAAPGSGTPNSARDMWRPGSGINDAAAHQSSKTTSGLGWPLTSCALMCAGHAAVTGSSWWLARAIDAGRAGRDWHEAVGILAGGAGAGALLLLLGLWLAAPPHGDASPALVCRLAVCVAIASGALVAIQCPASAIFGPGAALLLWACACAAAWAPAAELRLCARQVTAARRGVQLLIHEMGSPGAAVTVALHGSASRFGAELARLLDAGTAAERALLAAASRAGAASDILAAGTLAAVLFVPTSRVLTQWIGHHVPGIPATSGAALLGWAVLHGRWVGVAVQNGAAAWTHPPQPAEEKVGARHPDCE